MEFLGKLHGVSKSSTDSIEETEIHQSPSPQPSSAELQMLWNDHPVYSKYFKLLRMDIPKEHVQLKMAQSGLDPSILELLSVLLFINRNDPLSPVPSSFLE